MQINTNLDKHLFDIDIELECFELIEFKNNIKSLFVKTILPTKDELKSLSLVFRIAIDYINQNSEDIKDGYRNTDSIVNYVNDNIYGVKIDIFRLVFNKESSRLGFNIIVSLNESTCTYCLNDKININDVKYLTLDEIIDKMIILSIDMEEE
jgi:hypothetical protein